MSSEGTLLYTAATESLVAEQSGNNVYEKMMSYAIGLSSDYGLFMKDIKSTEKQIKTDFGITSMPNPWRSAKSVISSAMKLKIPLYDNNGNFKGKTSLQLAIKALKTDVKEEKTVDHYVSKIMTTIKNIEDQGIREDVISELLKYLED